MSASNRVLFATSNGTGLGHLTRSLAISAHLEPEMEPLIVTLSAAAPVVERLGRPVEYVASYDRPGAGNDLSWTMRTRERFRAAVREADPALVVFDGTHPYERLLPALRASGAPLVWCRRAVWRSGADTAPLHRSHLFDAILEPGEVGEAGSLGPTAERRAEAHRVDPIVLVRRAELLPRHEAARELGLDPERPAVLVQLGQGPGVGEAARRVIGVLAAREDLQVAAGGSTLAGLDRVPGAVVRVPASYPMARLFRAFDAAVTAAGYNQVHELAALGVPALLVPMPRDTDDQLARAREAERAGLALAAAGPGDGALAARVEALLAGAERERSDAGLAALAEWRGAEQAAGWLASLVVRPPTQGSARASGSTPQARHSSGATLGVRLRRAWIFASTVPRTLARIAQQTLTRARSRVHVVALGLPDADHESLVERALAAIDRPPAEVLVITDRLDAIDRLVRAGVGFEHVPAEGSRQAELSGLPYERFRAERLALIRARRPRPRTVIELPDGR